MHNFEPYDKIIELDIRLGLVESQLRDMQVTNIQLNQRLKEQHKMIAQCNKNIETLSNYLNHITKN